MSEIVEGQAVAEPGTDPNPVELEPNAENSPTDEIERDIAADTLEIPDSNAESGHVTYVPGSALKGARDEIKAVKAELETARAGSARAAGLEQQLSQAQATLAQYTQAYQALQQQQPAQNAALAYEDPDAEAFARNLDLYTAEGKPDTGKARAILGVIDSRAASQANASVQPLAAHTVYQVSQHMLQRALASTTPTGSKPHPDDLLAVWSRLDPSVTATVDGARQVYIQALGMSEATGRAIRGTAAPRATNGQFQPADIPPPLHTEKAGGKESNIAPMDDRDRRMAKDLGITDAEFLASARAMPSRR